MDRRIKIGLILLLSLLLFSCATVKDAGVLERADEQSLTAFLKGKCVNRYGEQIDVSSDLYLIYFAADWCPYCLEARDTMKSQFEILEAEYGIKVLFVGHERDTSNDDLLRYLDKEEFDIAYLPFEYREESGIFKLIGEDKFYIPGFLLLDDDRNVLSSSSGATLEDYQALRPINVFLSIEQCDCVLESIKEKLK